MKFRFADALAKNDNIAMFLRFCDSFELEFEYCWRLAAENSARDIFEVLISGGGGSWKHIGDFDEYPPSQHRVCILGSSRAGKSCLRYALARF